MTHETGGTDWRERLQRAVEKTLQARAAKRALREELAGRRRHGLEARHRNRTTHPRPDDQEDAQP